MICAAVTFEQWGQAWWLVLAPLAGIVMIGGLLLRRAAVRRAFDEAMQRRLHAGRSLLVVTIVRTALVMTAMVLLAAALMDPRRGEEIRPVMIRSVDIMIVLDCSRSMLAEDATPNRLERARRFIEDLLQAAEGDRAGLITFAGTSVLACPLTIDHGAVRAALRDADPNLMPRGGSLLGDALRLAGASFPDDIPDHKVVVVFTDGEDHESYPEEAARGLYRDRGIPVIAVGIGDATDGARIPIEAGDQRSFLQFEGQEVWSRHDERTLRLVAEAGGGRYVPAGTMLVDMGALYREHIRPIARRDLDGGEMRRGLVRFQWLILPAIILLLIEGAVRSGADIGPHAAYAGERR